MSGVLRLAWAMFLVVHLNAFGPHVRNWVLAEYDPARYRSRFTTERTEP